MKINNANLYNSYRNYCDLEFSMDNPDVLILHSDIKVVPEVFSINNASPKELIQKNIEEFDRLEKALFNFFDNYDGKSALIIGSAGFILAPYLLPDLLDTLYEVSKHDLPHNLKSLITGKTYKVNSKHDFLFDSNFIKAKMICDPAVTISKGYINPTKQLLNENYDETEVFSHVFKSITFCLSEILSEKADPEFVQEVLNISLNHKIEHNNE